MLDWLVGSELVSLFRDRFFRSVPCMLPEGDVLVLSSQCTLSVPVLLGLSGCPLLSSLARCVSLAALLGGAAVGLANTGSVGVGQQTTPSINTTSQIDPSSIERAYAALGLTYQGNQMQTQPQAQVKNQQQGQSPQSLRPMNPMSKSIW